VGIKDSCSIESAEALKTAVGTLPVYIGNDNQALASLQKGMRCITGACNACPELIIGLHEAYSRGDEAGADEMQWKVREWMSVVAKMPLMGEVPAVKAALNYRIGHAAGSQGDGVDEGGSYGMVCRPPLETLRKGADSHQHVVSWVQTNFSPS
jgi:dihydrodipicolinate synthase/N-acetylneuraminate lyase